MQLCVERRTDCVLERQGDAAAGTHDERAGNDGARNYTGSNCAVALHDALDDRIGEPDAADRCAEVMLVPLGGSKVSGTLRAEQRSDGVWITGDVSGLTPGKHGFHIHERGDCSASDGSSAGPHFAPASKSHGDPMAPEHHAGDMGNIQADADGTATIAYSREGRDAEGQ
jgi:Cu/Zn superoxide dismutase